MIVRPIPHRRAARARADNLYDEAWGPPAPVVRRPVPDEWDDPTFVAVEVDEGWMAHEDRKAEILNCGIESLQRRSYSRDTIERVLAFLAKAPATAREVGESLGMGFRAAQYQLRWMDVAGTVRTGHRPGVRGRELVYRPATPEGDAAWVSELTAIEAARREAEERRRRAARAAARPRPPRGPRPHVARRPPPPPPPEWHAAILRFLMENGESSVNRVAFGLDIPPTGVQDILKQLRAVGQVYALGRGGEPRYRLANS